MGLYVYLKDLTAICYIRGNGGYTSVALIFTTKDDPAAPVNTLGTI
jgi:hypothetical protein